MAAFNFKARWAGAVEVGKKRQTIRPKGKRERKVGELARCFTGQRTKQCRKLGAWPITKVTPVRIDWTEAIVGRRIVWRRDLLNEFAQADGFEDWHEMRVWFGGQYGLPADGMELVEW